MDNAIYATLGRQAGLMQEMQVIANNIANASTAGYRREGLIFAEHVRETGEAGGSLSLASAEARMVDRRQGSLDATGGALDLAIEGDAYFLLSGPDGLALSRGGAFQLSPEGEVVTPDGLRLLDSSASAIQVPPGSGPLTVSRDGILSVDDQPVAQVGLFSDAGAATERQAGARFALSGDPVPAEAGQIYQGFLENSNVNPVTEIARMIEVQRAYEIGQSLLQAEDARIRAVTQTLSG